MQQLELFEGLVPVREYLHVWTEAERAARIKKEPGAEAQGEIPENRAQEGQTIAVCQRITQPSSASRLPCSGKCQAESGAVSHAIAATCKRG